jgi:hypothetical protein
LTANGLMRNGLSRGNTGVQTVYDVFAVAPLGRGVLDTTPGNTLVTGYLTGKEIKNVLEFCLSGSPARPGDYFPRASAAARQRRSRFRSRPLGLACRSPYLMRPPRLKPGVG